MRSAEPGPAPLAIGELSRRTGINIETIRYDERINMMPYPPRTSTGRRVYGEVETRRLAFIRRARELGLASTKSVHCSHFPPRRGARHAPKSVSLRRTTLRMFGQRSPTSERWSASWPMLSADATTANPLGVP